MKTKIFLPVVAMLSLMLFSFTTNTLENYSVVQLANGNFELRNVPISEEDEFRMNSITENLTVTQRINEMGDEAILAGIWVASNETWDENKKFTKKRIAGSELAAYFGNEFDEEIHQARLEIGGILQHYMR